MAVNVPQGLSAAAIASQGGGSLAAAVMPSLAGRSVTSYAQSFMIVGIIISVIGVAAAIFTSSILAGVGFGLAGIVSVIGVFVAQSAFEGEQLQNAIAQLNLQNAFLDDQRIRLDSASKFLKGENDRLKQAQGGLDLKCKELEGENTRIQQVSSDLRLSLQGMTASNRLLSESKSVLVAKVAELQGYVTEAKSTLQIFLQTYKEFSSNVSAFALVIPSLDKTEALIQRVISDLETKETEALLRLREHVTLATEIADYIHTRGEREQHLQLLAIPTYQEEVSTLRTSIGSLQNSVKDLERIHAAFASESEHSESIGSLQSKHREALAELITALEAGVAKFERERGKLIAETVVLQRTLTEFVTQRDALLHTLENPLSRMIPDPKAGVTSV